MRAYLSLGSNLASEHGGPRETVLAGVDALCSEQVRVAGCSRVYRTEPVGEIAQPEFANLVVAVETELGADAMVERGLAIEAKFGRLRTVAGGPRVLDVDVLALGAVVHESSIARVPHPRLHRRRFVLVPLVEVAPDWVHPVLDKTATALLEELPSGEVVEPWMVPAELPARVG